MKQILVFLLILMTCLYIFEPKKVKSHKIVKIQYYEMSNINNYYLLIGNNSFYYYISKVPITNFISTTWHRSITIPKELIDVSVSDIINVPLSELPDNIEVDSLNIFIEENSISNEDNEE